jgi:hypothetical protein
MFAQALLPVVGPVEGEDHVHRFLRRAHFLELEDRGAAHGHHGQPTFRKVTLEAAY